MEEQGPLEGTQDSVAQGGIIEKHPRERNIEVFGGFFVQFKTLGVWNSKEGL